MSWNTCETPVSIRQPNSPGKTTRISRITGSFRLPVATVCQPMENGVLACTVYMVTGLWLAGPETQDSCTVVSLMWVTANASGAPGGPVTARNRDRSWRQPCFRPALNIPIQKQVLSGSTRLELHPPSPSLGLQSCNWFSWEGHRSMPWLVGSLRAQIEVSANLICGARAGMLASIKLPVCLSGHWNAT